MCETIGMQSIRRRDFEGIANCDKKERYSNQSPISGCF